jgi:hypothetical protein
MANLVASAPTTLNTLNELATALGNDPNFATTITTSIGTKVPQSRTITINGTAYDLSADRAWTIASGVTSFNTRTGAITLTSGDVTGALGFTPYNATNPSGYISGITSAMVTGALGYTPYNSSNPSGYISGITSLMVTNALGYTPYNSSNPAGYITASTLTSYLPLSGGNMTGNLRLVSISGNDQTVENTYGAYLHLGAWGVGRTDATAVLVNTAYRADYADALFDMNISRFTNNSGYITSSALGAYLPLSGGTLTGTVTVNGGYSFVAGGYNNNGGFAMNNGGQYWGLMWNMATNDWRLGRGSQTAQNGWNLRWDSGDNVFINQHLYLNNNYGSTIVGAYSSTVYQGVFAMGDAYKLPLNGSSPGSLYGLAWSHPNAGGQAGYLNDHGLLVMVNGLTYASISSNIWTRGSLNANTNVNATSGYFYGSGSIRCGDMWGGAGLYRPSGSMVFGIENSDWIFSKGAVTQAYFGGGDGNLWMRWAGDWLSNLLGAKATHRGEGSNYVDYSRYVYNNGAYSGSGWIEPSDLGVRYAASAGYASSAGSAGSAGNSDTVDGYHMNQAVTVNASPTFQEVYANGWFRSTGYSGHYNPTNGAHWYPNDNSYGTWKIHGSRNGWGGHVTNHNYILSLMLNTSGDYGFLTENGNWWNLFYNNGNNCWGIGTDNTYSGDGFRCIKYGSAQYGWTTWSDRRAKENIASITGALDTVLAMRGVYFNYIQDEAKNKRVGFIAQELEQVLPEAVRYAEEIDEYSVEYAQIVSVLAEAIKEQNAKITRLESLVEQLTNN